MTRDGVTLSAAVAPGGEETIRYEAEENSTVEEVSVRLYDGAEFTLRLYPRIERKDGTNDYDLVELAGKEYIDGDDELFHWSVSEPLREGDEIVVEAINHDGNNERNFRMNCDIDSLGGTSRGLARIIDLFRGVI